MSETSDDMAADSQLIPDITDLRMVRKKAPMPTPPVVKAPLPSRPAAVVAPAPRMTLENIRRGKHPAPDRILLHGTEGVGKTTFGAESHSPIFICTEDGARKFDVASFPEPTTFAEILESVRTLENEKHDFKTLVIDSIDWVALRINDAVCTREKWSQEDFEKYGRGCKVWINEWRQLLAACDSLRLKRGMEILLISHTRVGTFKNPSGEDFMRYVLAVPGAEAPALVIGWADTVMFAAHEEFTSGDPKRGKVKGVSSGKRLLHTERTAAWDAKNRDGLPPVIPLSYAEFDAARSGAGTPSIDELFEECLRLAEGNDEAIAYVTENKTDKHALTQALNSLRAKE
jgi:hypothetical protein